MLIIFISFAELLVRVDRSDSPQVSILSKTFLHISDSFVHQAQSDYRSVFVLRVRDDIMFDT